VKRLRFLLVALLLPPLISLAAACSDDSSSGAGASPSATAVAIVRGQVIVNFAGAPSQRSNVSIAFAVSPGTKAFDAIKRALGESNLNTQDFGGSLGLLITGFYGVQAQGNHFWEFLLNGKSSDVGVSGYEVKEGDVLEFRYASF